jgi:acetylornithine deacetylase/succinyl-diaminopimelate desuccinylase-like protein
MPTTAKVEAPRAQQEVERLAALPAVQQALAWFAAHAPDLRRWQIELARIPAPPFGEAVRAEWLRQRFAELGLEDVRIDSVGNVLGVRRGAEHDAQRGGKFVALTAHIDTVFPAGTPLDIRDEGGKLRGPGISDNASGVTALLALAGALGASPLPHSANILFVGNVGEEGEGDLRGMRHLFSDPQWKDALAYTLVLDGSGSDTIVTQALGSRRFEVTVRGPGGHSWSDFGAPNPIVLLARAIANFSRAKLPSEPRTSASVGVIQGGTSVNTIPESASARVDIRSTAQDEMERLERALRAAVEEAVAEDATGQPRSSKSRASFEITSIGSRPAAELREGARILEVVRAVDAHLGNTARLHRASTDANVPLSLGLEAVSLGAGGAGGGAHTLHEWYDPSGRELALQRILLAALTLAGVCE